MEALSKLFISILELFEAEFRAFRAGSAKLFASFVLMVVGGMIIIGGIGLIVAGLFCLIYPIVGRVSAFLLLGLFCMLTAYILFMTAARYAGEKE